MLKLYKKENSVHLIFAHKATRENILTAKITQTTVSNIFTRVCYTLVPKMRVHPEMFHVY